jgi:uncharacterized protein
MSSGIKENMQQHRFELPVGSAAHYRVEDDRIVLIHAEVPTEFSRRGIASHLAAEI